MSVKSPFANHVRVRVNGLLYENGKLLLVKLNSPTREEPFWTPPGGGVVFGERLEETLKREFIEETGLEIEINSLFYVNEFVEKPWHAVEFYFLCTRIAGTLKKGSDPELLETHQIITDIRFIDISDEAVAIEPAFIRERFLRDFQDQTNTPLWIR